MSRPPLPAPPPPAPPSPSADSAPLSTGRLALRCVLARLGYDAAQHKGQLVARLGPDKWGPGPPPREFEVFITGIPHDCYEDEVFPVFFSAGLIYEFRLLVNFSGSCRGTAYIMYTNDRDMKVAVETYNDYEIRHNVKLAVSISINNCKIQIMKIPLDVSYVKYGTFLYGTTTEVTEIHFRVEHNLQDIIIVYKSHRSAAMARRKLLKTFPTIIHKNAHVEWAMGNASDHLYKYPYVIIRNAEGYLVAMSKNTDDIKYLSPIVSAIKEIENQADLPNSDHRCKINICYREDDTTGYNGKGPNGCFVTALFNEEAKRSNIERQKSLLQDSAKLGCNQSDVNNEYNDYFQRKNVPVRVNQHQFIPNNNNDADLDQRLHENLISLNSFSLPAATLQNSNSSEFKFLPRISLNSDRFREPASETSTLLKGLLKSTPSTSARVDPTDLPIKHSTPSFLQYKTDIDDVKQVKPMLFERSNNRSSSKWWENGNVIDKYNEKIDLSRGCVNSSPNTWQGELDMFTKSENPQHFANQVPIRRQTELTNENLEYYRNTIDNIRQHSGHVSAPLRENVASIDGSEQAKPLEVQEDAERDDILLPLKSLWESSYSHFKK